MSSKGVIEAPGRYRPRKMVSTGIWIRDHLLQNVEDYPFNMWHQFKKLKKNPGTYQNFRNFVYWLLQLELIKFVREEPSDAFNFQPRRLYTYVPENIDKDELWRNPRRSLYPESWEKGH